jgi:hypothetical protein
LKEDETHHQPLSKNLGVFYSASHCEECNNEAIHKQGRALSFKIFFSRKTIFVDCFFAKNKFWLIAMTF